MSTYTSNEFTVSKAFRMKEGMAGKLAAYAARHGISEGEAMRVALDKLLSPVKEGAAAGYEEPFNGRTRTMTDKDEGSSMVAFTVDMQNLVRELAKDYTDKPAAWGALYGLGIGCGYIAKIAREADRIGNVPIILWCYALGFIENPLSNLRGRGFMTPEYEELARQIGLQ